MRYFYGSRLRYLASLVLTVLCFSSTPVFAVDIDAGLSLGSIAFEVKKTNNGGLLGEMNEDLGANVYLATRFKQNDGLWGTNWGYLIEMGFGTFNINTQAVNKELVSLGTHVNGKYAYLTWILYYKHHYKADAYFAYGIGAGVGYLSADGTVKLTEETGEPVIGVTINDVSTSAGLYAEYFRRKWFIRLAAYGPKYTEEPYEFGISEAKIIFGHRFTW